jgi:hypothetical protein
MMAGDANDLSQEGLAALAQGVQAGIAVEDARPLAPLRHRPTWQRNLLGLMLLFTVVIVAYAVFPRRDMVHYPLPRLGAELAAMVVAFGLCLVVAMRGTHRAELPRGVTYGLVALAVLVVASFGLLPAPHSHDAYVSRGIGELIGPCTFIGLGIALPVYALFRLLRRGSALGAFAAAAAAGLVANTFLHGHCSMTAGSHLVLAHAMVGVWLLLGVGVMQAVQRRRGVRIA